MQKKKRVDPWRQYETEKRRIRALNLPPQQYEAEMKRLCDRLKI